MTSVARIDLERIEAAFRFAKPGPWIVRDKFDVYCTAEAEAITGFVNENRYVAVDIWRGDAEYIALVDPETVGALVHAVKAAREIDHFLSAVGYTSAAKVIAELRAALRPFTEEPGQKGENLGGHHDGPSGGEPDAA